MNKYFGIFLVLGSVVWGAYNPFFDNQEAPKKVVRPAPVLLPPPPPVAQPVLYQRPLSSELVRPSSVQISYFGYIETERGKFALIKVNQHNIVLKEKNRVYIENVPHYVQEINSNTIVLEDNEKRIKTLYFSSAKEGGKE